MVGKKESEMSQIPYRPTAQCEIAILPDPRIQTLDRVQVKLGMKLFHKFTPGAAVEYEVLLDMAFRNPHTKEWQIVLLGPHLPVMSRPVSLFVADLDEWRNFYAKRHGNQAAEVALPENESLPNPSGKPSRRRGRRRRKEEKP